MKRLIPIVLVVAVVLAGCGGTPKKPLVAVWATGDCAHSANLSCWAVGGAAGVLHASDRVTQAPSDVVTTMWFGSSAGWPQGYGGDFSVGCTTGPCNPSASYVVSHSLQGVWTFRAGNCVGGNLPCHLSHNLYTYACVKNLVGKCDESAPDWSSSFSDRPFARHSRLSVSAYQGVVRWQGTELHGFLCADFMNVVSALTIEDCAETWSAYVPDVAVGQVNCAGTAFGAPGILAWTRYGASSGYLKSVGREIVAPFSGGLSHRGVGIVVTAAQLNGIVASCGRSAVPSGNWALFETENGFEGGGSSQSGGSIVWQDNETFDVVKSS